MRSAAHPRGVLPPLNPNPLPPACLQAPVAICRKPFVGEQCVHICLFVSDNEASRKALRLAKALMQNDANFLRIVTVASTQTGIHRAEDMMAYYRELLGIVPSNQLVTEVVVRRHGTTVETLLDYVARLPLPPPPSPLAPLTSNVNP